MSEIKYRKLSTYLWQIILILLGVGSVGLSFAMKSDRWFTTFNGIGISLLLSGLLGIFVNVLFSRREARLDVYEKWKIANIYESRAIANQAVYACQEKARKRVDIIAFGLSSWRQAKEQLIDEMLNKKVQIRIITMDPYCDVLSMRDIAEGKADGSTKKSILQLHEFFDKTQKRRTVQIKYHRQLPLDFYFRVDDHVFVGPYIFGKDSQQMITYEFERSGEGFKYYTDYFEKLWTGNSVPKLQLMKYEELNRIEQV